MANHSSSIFKLISSSLLWFFSRPLELETGTRKVINCSVITMVKTKKRLYIELEELLGDCCHLACFFGAAIDAL